MKTLTLKELIAKLNDIAQDKPENLNLPVFVYVDNERYVIADFDTNMDDCIDINAINI